MKKAVSMLVVLAMMVSMVTFVYADTTFSDVPEDHWAYNEIQYFYNQNIVDGIGNDKFAPDDNVTREQLAKLISIIYGKTDYQATSQTFGDVTPDMWSYNYIESVKEYLTGYYPADGQAFYNPNAYATREDVAYALVKISDLDKQITADTSVLEKFEDNLQISYNLREYMAIAVQSGLMQGYDGELRPQDGITRSETVTLLFRAMKKPVEEDDVEKVPDEKADEETKTEDIKTEEVPVTEDKTEFEIPEISAGNSIYSDGVIELKIINHETENTDLTSLASRKRLKGSVEMIIGDDVMKDSKLVATVVVDDKDVYKLESYNVTRYGRNSNSVYFGFDYILTKNGEVIIGNGKKPSNILAVAREEEETLTLTGQFYVFAENIRWTPFDLPSVPDNQPWELWADSSFVAAEATEFNGNEANGYFNITYISTKDIAQTDSEIKCGEDVYKIELAEPTSVSNSAIYGKFNITKNGELVAENVSGKISGMGGKLEDTVEFTTDDGIWNVKMYMVEITR